MFHSVYFDSKHSDDVRRKNLYDGQLYVYSAKPSMMKFIEHARKMIEEAFGSINPSKAQYSMPVEKYVEIVAPLKPRFIHHADTKQLIQNILKEYGCDLNTTYLDVPRLRMVTSDGYLTSGVGYAHHPHRDTWYSAPMAQLNWWVPIYDITTDMSMAFHPNYWNTPIKNGSATFNYYEWNSVGRKSAASQIKTDTRKQPKPEEPLTLEPQLRLVLPAGSVVIFSAAQLHSTVPNNSGLARYSIDFRTVNLEEVKTQGGAANIDSHCTGTSLRDFMRGSDLSRMPDDVIAPYDATSTFEGELIFKPETIGAGR